MHRSAAKSALQQNQQIVRNRRDHSARRRTEFQNQLTPELTPGFRLPIAPRRAYRYRRSPQRPKRGSECIPKCARKLLDTADIVRDRDFSPITRCSIIGSKMRDAVCSADHLLPIRELQLKRHVGPHCMPELNDDVFFVASFGDSRREASLSTYG